jgi:hypothetical protein
MSGEEKAAEVIIKAAREAAKPDGPYVNVYKLTPRLKRVLVGRFVLDGEEVKAENLADSRVVGNTMGSLEDGVLAPDGKKTVKPSDGMAFLEALSPALASSARVEASGVLGK